MHSCLSDFGNRPRTLGKLYPQVRNPIVRILSVVLLTLLLGAWDSCTAFVGFTSCPGPVPQARISSLSPSAIPGNANLVPLTVSGNGFTSQSQILWNGSSLATVFTDSRHLEATITQQTFESFGGSSGGNVQITVRSQGSGTVCPPGGNSEAVASGATQAVPLAID